MVTEFLAKRITDVFIRRLQIEEEDRDLFYLGIEVIVNTTLTALVILALSVLLHNFWGAVLFLCCFVNVRSYSGGYHAKTRLHCFVVSILCYLVSYGMMEGLLRLGTAMQIIIITMGVLASLVVFVKYAPVENPNKRIRDELLQRNRIMSFFLLVAWLIASGFLVLCYKYEFASQIWATTVIIAGLLWVARRKK